MTTHAYSPLYLAKASRAVGNMLHDAVLVFGMDGTDFLKRFIQSDVAEQFESGNPKYIAGKSGLELFLEVMEKTTGEAYDTNLVESYERSPEYWVGWMLTHYQWYSGRTFKNILDTFWWSIVTFTTVGYGDMVVTSSIGKILVSLEVFFGVTIAAAWASVVIKRMTR